MESGNSIGILSSRSHKLAPDQRSTVFPFNSEVKADFFSFLISSIQNLDKAQPQAKTAQLVYHQLFWFLLVPCTCKMNLVSSSLTFFLKTVG